MSKAGLLAKLVTNLSNEITSRGLTAYFLIDPKGGGTKVTVASQVNAQQAIANGLRANGVTIGDITDALTQTFDDRGVLIVWSGRRWMERKNVMQKLRTAIQIRWILVINSRMNDGDIEDFDLVMERNVKDGDDNIDIQAWKRIKVFV